MDPSVVTPFASVVGAVVALLSAAIAVLQARASKRSADSAVVQARASQQAADSAAESNRLERHRQEIDQTPQLTGDYDGPGGGHGQLLLTNHGPLSLERIHVAVCAGPWGEPPLVLFDIDGEPARERASAGLHVGEQVPYDLTPWQEEPAGRQEFDVVAHHRDGRSWRQRVACDVLGSPRIRILG